MNELATLRLTNRELTVLRLLATGATARCIGRTLGCSPRTVSTHLDNVYRKLGVNDRLRAVQVGQALGLIAAPTANTTDRAIRLVHDRPWER